MGRVVLVTGAAGLLGAALIERLLARGDRVVAVVRDRDPASRFYRDGLVNACTEVRAELADASRLIGEYQPTHVVHLAAQTQVPTGQRSPVSTLESNVRGTWLLLEACRLSHTRIAGIVVASSDKAYGTAPPPYGEGTPLLASGIYDVSKAAADMIARAYATQYGLPIVVTRCGNIYGPGDINEIRLVPVVCRALLRGVAPALRSTGRMVREWVYVSDAADALLLLLGAAEEHAGAAYNVGSGQVASVSAVVHMLVALSGAGCVPVFRPTDPAEEIPVQALDCSRLSQIGWTPRVGLEEGLRLTWEWYTTCSSSAVAN